MAIDTLDATISQEFKWSASKNFTGADFSSPLSAPGTIRRSQRLKTDVANAVAGGANCLASFIVTVGAGGVAAVDCTALTNIIQETGVALARIKGYQIALLSLADDATNGTNCSQVTVGNANNNQQNLNLGVNGTFFLKNGGCQSYSDPSAGGFTAVNNTTKNILFTNNDANVAAKVVLSLVGGTN